MTHLENLGAAERVCAGETAPRPAPDGPPSPASPPSEARPRMKLRQAIRSDPAWALFLAFAFLCMVSMPLARVAMLLSLAFALSSRKTRGGFRLTPPAIGWLAYLALALAASAVLAHTLDDPLLVPRRGLLKITKLAWFAAIPLTASLVATRKRAGAILRALVVGGATLAAFVLLVHPALAWLQVHYPAAAWLRDHYATTAQLDHDLARRVLSLAHLPAGDTATGLAATLHSIASSLGVDRALDKALSGDAWAPWGGRPPSFHHAFTSMGSMHDAQRLMVALVAAVCLLLPERPAGRRPERFARHALAAAAIAMGLVLTCKRGPLLVGVGASFLLLASRVRLWKPLLLLGCVGLAAFAVPDVRARLSDLPGELQVKNGGRALMWTRIVPALHAEHPFGIGFRSLTAEKMRSVDRRVERNRTHVHSVPLQAFVDFGHAGIAAWLLWMLLSFWTAWQVAADGRGGAGEGLALFPLAALSSLALFGLVEYNIADAAVVPLYAIAMGLSCPLYLAREDGRCEIAFVEKVFLKPLGEDAKLRGVELFNLGLVRDLAASGRRLFLPVHRSWERRIAAEAAAGAGNLRLRRIPNLLHPAATCLAAALAVAGEARARGRFPVLFVANDANGVAPAVWAMSKLRSFRKMVLLAHKMPGGQFLAAIAKIPGHVVCVCESIAKEFRAAGVAAAAHADYGIANADLFFPAEGKAPQEGRRLRFCLLGDLGSDWKGADTALAAFERLPKEFRALAELHIKAFRKPRDFPPGSGIVSHPWTAAGDIPAFLREMDVLLATSRNRLSDGRLMETFSQTTVQGMLTGLPVIHTSIAPYLEKFDEGGGILADTPGEIAEAMMRVIDDPALRQRLGREGRATALARYVWNTSRFYDRYMK